MSDPSPSRQLLSMIWPGALTSQAIYVVGELGIADLVDQDPQSVGELARRSGAESAALARVLRVLTSLGVFVEDPPGFVAHTPLSRTLRTDHPESVRAWARFLGSPCLWRPWGELLHTVRTGENGFRKVFGMDFDRYMAEHPEDGELYNEAMGAGAAMFAAACVAAYDFSNCRRIVDVGGGRGALLAAILRANPEASGVLFDLPAVVDGASLLEETDLKERCERVSGDFLKEALPAGGDAYILKGILHGFSDERAAQVLENCRQAMRADGRLLVVEALPQEAQEPSPQKAFMDLMMLTLSTGMERSEDELRSLLRRSGFEVTRVIPTSAGNSIVEARPDERAGS